MCAGFCALAQALALPVRRDVFISWDGAAATHFVNHPGYSPGIAVLNSHIYARPCIAPAAGCFALTNG